MPFKSFYGAQAILHDKEYLAMLECLENEEDRDAGLTTRSDYMEVHDLMMIARQQHQKETVMMECRLNVKSTELRYNGFMRSRRVFTVFGLQADGEVLSNCTIILTGIYFFGAVIVVWLSPPSLRTSRDSMARILLYKDRHLFRKRYKTL